MVYAVDAFRKKSFFYPCNLITSGPREGCESSLKDAGDFENPFARLQCRAT